MNHKSVQSASGSGFTGWEEQLLGPAGAELGPAGAELGCVRVSAVLGHGWHRGAEPGHGPSVSPAPPRAQGTLQPLQNCNKGSTFLQELQPRVWISDASRVCRLI